MKLPHRVARQYNKQQNKRRYNLHYKVKLEGYDVHCSKKTIYVPAGEDIGDSTFIPKLIKEFGYQVQIIIPH